MAIESFIDSLALPTTDLLGFFLAAVAVYFLFSAIYTWSRLRKIPGPFIASFSYWWALSSVVSGREPWVYAALAEKYGHLVRIGPRLLLTDDPDVLRRMSGTRSQYNKDASYLSSIRHPDYHTMFSTLDASAHDAIKAKLANPYGGRETLGMEPIVDGMINALLHHLRSKTTQNACLSTTVNFATIASYFTLDTITRITFGKAMGFLETDTDVGGLFAGGRSALRTFTIPMSIPWLRRITLSGWFLRTLGPKSTDTEGFGLVMGAAEKAVRERYRPGAPDEKDLMGAFKRHGLEEGPCLSEVLFAVTAGSDTAASTMRCTMLYLMSTPRVYNKLKFVVSEAVRKGGISSPIKQEEAKAIPYLQAVIYEGLRMRPPVPTMFPKVVPPQGDEIDGKFIPGGTSIGWNLMPMMRSPRYWGHDPEIFRPERFIEADDKARLAMKRNVDIAFGYGRYGCAGKPLAVMELNKFYFELFRNFDFQLVNPMKPWESECWSIWTEDNYFVQVTESECA
ncbi:hypothetical protein KVR01_012387 [Diaporthe batatas]|uniref:uncharacterized protein n=1 Tax=Diaporthe batatas TaxID=748121 RepID=UPI001D05BBD5|nr:uncharacterized protein KVR01_012387 [Diaporthe batatas]KAG8157725.1 hypothetical protein KVR01_012387 [Diaporthe batatas]